MKNLFLILTAVVLTVLSSCKKDEASFSDLTLDLTGLEDLGGNFVYEGWLVVDGTPITTGTFSVNSSGVLSKTKFPIDSDQLQKASDFVLTIEPANDSDPAPASTHLLSGSFSGNTAMVTTATVADFSNVSGKYILATPTNGPMSSENSGIWFLDLSTGAPTEGLKLPTLSSGWKYEGWVVINGTPVSTGTFTNTKATDEFDGYSGPMALGMVNGSDGFFPGEDFLKAAPTGLSFPTNIAGGKAVISVEPFPDNSAAPFTIKPLVGDIPADAVDHVNYEMSKNTTMPMGSVSR
ncbi:MAG TPA: anti-sigma factor [Saprospiraceae bacterium]|nr:anti-sigma factor [Saprospiraceae bacterium]